MRRITGFTAATVLGDCRRRALCARAWKRDGLGTTARMSSLSSVRGRRRLAVEFTAPGAVRVVEEDVPERPLGHATVLARVSAISAGTERKVLEEGMGMAGEAVDPSLAALRVQQGGWPIRYGYCLVGRVEVGDSCAQGTRVFCFHPHASVANVLEDDLLKVPEEISDEDAAFFANVETACSLVQDTAPVVGDRIAVHGAGVVGALTAGILAHHRHDVTVFEPCAARVAALRKAFPQIKAGADDGATPSFDVAIEASGSPAALGQALGGLRRGGRVVVGSWYGEAEVPLLLGLRFHRSEISIVASQVSRISAPLATRWSKQRRAELAWELLGILRPSEWVPMQRYLVSDAPVAYKAVMGSASAAQVLLTYDSVSRPLEK